MQITVEFKPEELGHAELRNVISECERVMTYRRNILRKHPPHSGEFPHEYGQRLSQFYSMATAFAVLEIHHEQLEKQILEQNSIPNGTGFIKN